MSGRNPRPGDLYRHFKGKLYQIVALAQDAESGERKVVYQALYGDFKTYVRDYSEFISEVDAVKYPGITAKYRFESLRPEEAEETAKLDEQKEAVPARNMAAVSENSKAEAEQVLPEQSETQSQQELPNEQEPSGPHTQSMAAEQEPSELQAQSKAVEKQPTEEPKEPEINPDLLEFLDAKGNDEKIEVLYHIRKRVDENVMSAIEASLDISHSIGDLDDRVMFVRNILATRAKYEGGRLR